MFLYSLKNKPGDLIEINREYASISTGPSTSERMKWFISLQTVSEGIIIFTLEYHIDMTCISWWHLPPFLFLCLPVLPVCLFYKTHIVVSHLAGLQIKAAAQERWSVWEAHRCGWQSSLPDQQSAGWRCTRLMSLTIIVDEACKMDGLKSYSSTLSLTTVSTLLLEMRYGKPDVSAGVYLTVGFVNLVNSSTAKLVGRCCVF